MEENIGTMVGQVARLMRRSFDERARGIGVTRPQWQVLTLLARHEGINQGALADMLEVEPITLGRMIDRLQEADLVERRPDPADRRAWRLFNTAKGTALLDQLLPFANETFEIALDGIAQTDRDNLMDILIKIRANLTRKVPPAGKLATGPAPLPDAATPA
ncbi:MAG: MarR family transcriptional regulator [Pseudomonadota bacterium]|nr:MarR family transcriptional regulator [Pseudomonadota bacterium]